MSGIVEMAIGGIIAAVFIGRRVIYRSLEYLEWRVIIGLAAIALGIGIGWVSALFVTSVARIPMKEVVETVKLSPLPIPGTNGKFLLMKDEGSGAALLHYWYRTDKGKSGHTNPEITTVTYTEGGSELLVHDTSFVNPLFRWIALEPDVFERYEFLVPEGSITYRQRN